MNKKLTVLFLCTFHLLVSGIFAEESSSGDLARVAIFNYEDRTNTENFQYLSGSLSDAVDSSMQKNFTYERITAENADELMTNSKEMVKDTEGDDDDRLQAQYKILAKELNADIIISGYYIFNENDQNIEIFTQMYYVTSRDFAEIPALSNKVDSTIFGATEKVAKNIISEIRKMAEKTAEVLSESESTVTDEADDKKPDDEKIVLTKKLAKKFSRFMDHFNGIITDNKTGLDWQKCEPRRNNKKTCKSGHITEKWELARSYCRNLNIGGKSWDLPSISQLESLVNPKASRPATFILFAPYTDNRHNSYWTSVEGMSDRSVFVINFIDATMTIVPKNQKNNTRCVVTRATETSLEKDRKKYIQKISKVLIDDLILSIKLKNIKRVQEVVDTGVSGRPLDDALIEAARAGDTRIIKILLKAGADINAKNENGEDVLEIAEKNQRGRAVRVLQKYK